MQGNIKDFSSFISVFLNPRLLATIAYFGTFGLVLRIFHPSFKKLLLQINTNKPQAINKYFTDVNYHRTYTESSAVGGYSRAERQIFHLVINAEELWDIIEDVQVIDNISFITTMKVENVFGQFNVIPYTKEDKSLEELRKLKQLKLLKLKNLDEKNKELKIKKQIKKQIKKLPIKKSTKITKK